MKYVYLLKYNNYCNRIMKVENSVSDYLGTSNANLVALVEDMLNWNPNDGVTASIKTPVNTSFDAREPDYCICADEYGNIDSRWFVIENIRTRKGQYLCNLKRDVFAEAWDDLMQASCNIDRAILLNEDSLIFNPEPITVNRILHSEYPIKDKTGVPWIVFYSAEKPARQTNVDLEKRYYDVSTDNLNAWKTQKQISFLPNDLQSIQVNLKWIANQYKYGPLHLIPNGLDASDDPGATAIIGQGIWTLTNPSGVDNDAILSAFKTQFTLKSAQDAAEIIALDGKTIYDTSASKYYTIHASASTVSTNQAAVAVSGSDTFEWAVDTVADCSNHPNYVPATNNIVTIYQYCTVIISFTELSSPTAVDFEVPQDSCRPNDAPYYIWCMPYGEIEMEVTAGTPSETKTVKSNAKLNLAIANYFANKNTSDATFDVQLLPFCPLPDEFIDSLDGHIIVADESITDHNTIVNHGDSTTLGYIFACPAATFTRQIKRKFYPYFPSYKMSDICNICRLYAPNYSASFEFSPARNNGIEGFNVRCTYIPIQPYIRVAPIWGGLYGNENFDKDPRGLICSGNYSIARLNDAWVQYQEQNKNFEAIFNREIQHMDVQRKYERASQIGGAIAGTVTGAAAGAAAGAFVGGGVGAAVGGVVGGVGAAVTGDADVVHAEKLFQESKSYATDMHFMQLGNVQAIPRSLAKTTAFNVDNRFFPILSFYLPTENEVNMVDEYINTHSMNVNAVGKPENYIYNRYCKEGSTYTDRGFISGSIIKIETTFDTHFVDELNKEFQKGVYLR